MDKYAEYSPKSESSKPAEEEEEARNLKLLYRKTGNMERDKSSGVSSDDETTSSSLLPIPDTLRQMRTEIKRNIADIGEPSEVESSLMAYEDVEGPTQKVRNSLDELRRKYTLKTETSVAIKMDSANLMLDDILKNNSMTANYSESSNFFREKEFKPKAMLETESSTVESVVEFSKHCNPSPKVLPHSLPPIAFGYPPHFCPKHKNGCKHVCGTHNPKEKAPKLQEENAEETQKRKSLVEKFQNLHIKYRIQSVYKMMQKNPFSRGRKDSEQTQVEQGIPGATSEEPSVTSQCKCGANKGGRTQYPRKMIFDLVETSETSRSESKSTESPGFCTCYRPRECTCAEVASRCSCEECVSESAEQSSKPETPHTPTPKKVNEYIQTEAEVVPKAPPQEKVPETKEQKVEEVPVRKKVNSVIPKQKQPGGFRKCIRQRKLLERTDIYYFDHGNSAYYQTTDNHPVRYTECLVERTDEYATKFWAEFFGAIEVGIAFLISFILQLYRFIFTSVVRSLIIGLLQIFSDYFFKPILTIIFNGLIQPCLILAYNIATSFRDLCLPISQTFGFFAKEVATIFRSCRLVEVNQCNCKQSSCYCGNKV